MPRTHSSYVSRTFAAAEPRLWNSIPVQLPNPDITYGLFRRQLKRHIFRKHKRGDLWLLICGALEKHLLTYLLTYQVTSISHQHYLVFAPTDIAKTKNSILAHHSWRWRTDNKKLSYRDNAGRLSLRRSRPFRVTDFGTNALCDFILVTNTYILSLTVYKLLQITGQICACDTWGYLF